MTQLASLTPLFGIYFQQNILDSIQAQKAKKSIFIVVPVLIVLLP
jgi:hypothetical protein